MAKIDDGQIEAIRRRVMQEIGATAQSPTPTPQPLASTRAPHLSYVGREGRQAGSTPRGGEWGIYPAINGAVAAAKVAFLALDKMTLQTRHNVVAAMREASRRHARELGEMAASETGMGRPEDKEKKNLLAADKTPGPEILTPDAQSGDHGLMLLERAPYGVFCAITPSTNPTSSIINNAIGLVSAGNATVFAGHPVANQGAARASWRRARRPAHRRTAAIVSSSNVSTPRKAPSPRIAHEPFTQETAVHPL